MQKYKRHIVGKRVLKHRFVMALLSSWILLGAIGNLLCKETQWWGMHTIIPPHVHFHLWQQNTYINFASTTNLENVIQTNDKLYLNQYWFSVENANLTISKFFVSYHLIFIVNASSEIASTTEVYVDDWGEPKSVYTNNETLTWSYDALTKILTVNVTHSSQSVKIIVDRRILGDVNNDGFVDIFDIGTISAHWYPGPPVGPLGYGSDTDLNNDGNVDILDIGIVSAHWTD